MNDYNYNDMVFNGLKNVPNHFILDGFDFKLKSEYNDSSKIMLFRVKKTDLATKDFIELLCQKVRMTVEMIYRVYIVSTSYWTTTKFGTNEQTFFLSYGILFSDDVLKGPKFSMEYSVGLVANNNYGISLPTNKFMIEIHRFENPNLTGFERVMFTTHIFFISMDNTMYQLDSKMDFINDNICKFISQEINDKLYSDLSSSGVKSINFTHHLIEDDYNLIIISELSGYNNITIESLTLNNASIEVCNNGIFHADDGFFNYFYTLLTSKPYELNVIFNTIYPSDKKLISIEGSKYLVDVDLCVIRLILKHPLVGHKVYNDGIREIQYIPLKPNLTPIDYIVNIPNLGECEDNYIKNLFFKYDTYVIDDSSIIDRNRLSVITVEKKYIRDYKRHLVYEIPDISQVTIDNLEYIPYIITIISREEFEEDISKLLKESKYEFNFKLIYYYSGYYYIGIYVKLKKERDINDV